MNWWDDAPAWPNFKVETYYLAGDTSYPPRWRAATDTGRPKTPIFVMSGQLPEGMTAHEVAQRALLEAYERAHPHGCPGGGH